MQLTSSSTSKSPPTTPNSGSSKPSAHISTRPPRNLLPGLTRLRQALIAANATASSTRFATPNTALRPQHKPAVAHRQGQPPVPAPPREDLRVLVSLEADAPARNHIGYAIRAHVASKTGLELNRIPQVLQVNTGWAVRAADKLTRDLLVEHQAEWADDLGATAVETSQKLYTYAVDNCPRRLTDLYGNELNYDAAVPDEISNRTGLTPISIRVPRRDNEQLPYKTLTISFLEPTKRPWSLFGTSRLARHIEITNHPRQCENCWDYHTRQACNRQTRCKRCGRQTTPVTVAMPPSSVPTASDHMPRTLRHARRGQRESMACFIVPPKNNER